MNLALSDEQELLREAARGTLSRTKTLEAAREALDGGTLPDLWPAAGEAGWPGLLIADERGGAGLHAFDAMLVLQECGRVLAGVPLLGHLVATWLLDRAGWEGTGALASGERRAAWLPARPPDDLDDAWTAQARSGPRRASAPQVRDGALTGEVAWVPDAPAADVLVVVGEGGGVVVLEAGADGVEVQEARRYDPTRALGHVRLDGARGTALDVAPADAAYAWHLGQALLASESVGAVEACLEMAVAYAKERFTFGRAIGSYQAVKHGLVEVMRRLENARSLLMYAGWAAESGIDELAVAAAAARSTAGAALDYAARENIAVHGGIGATWEHDAPLFFRRAQLSRRLLGGTADASERVAAELFAGTGGGTPAVQDAAAAATAAG